MMSVARDNNPNRNNRAAISASDHILKVRNLLIASAIMIAFAFVFTASAKAGKIEDKFRQSDPASTVKIDHGIWDGLLKTYVKPDSNGSGLNRVNYSAFKKMGQKSLKAYIDKLQSVDVTKLNRDEQYALWANLYNAKTIDIILAHYPVKTIRDIDISPGLFADGPWKKKVVTVNGLKLSLDDIEHKIMRGLFKDPRVHYAANCASVGCPNLGTEAFVGDRISPQLDFAARAYVNSPRGVKITGNRIIVSKIYSWYDEDFGNSERGVLAHLRKYAKPELKQKLAGKTSISGYVYDWTLNDTR